METRDIKVETLSGVPVGELQVEMVERKGVGHPDSICDAIMDRVSVELSKEYISQFGRILHHNIDKAFLVAGDAETRFGGGTIKEPMRLVFGDRATYGINGRELADRIRTAWPKTAVLYTSGYTADVIAQRGVLQPAVAYIPKPYTAAEIAAKVRELLEQKD